VRWAFYFFSWLFRDAALSGHQGDIRSTVDGGLFCCTPSAQCGHEHFRNSFGKEKSQAELKKICKDCF